MRICERNNSADPKVSGGEGWGGGGGPGTGVEIPLKTVVKAMVKQPMEVNGGAAVHLQTMEDLLLEQKDTQRRL